MKRKTLSVIVFLFCLFLILSEVQAEETAMEEYDFGEIQEFIEESFGEESFEFEDLVQGLVKGNLSLSVERIAGVLWDILAGQIQRNQKLLGRVMILAVSAAVFSNIASVFQDNQISQNAWFVIYLMLSGTLFGGFAGCCETTVKYLETMLTFIELLMPAFCMALSCICGAVATGAYYQLTFILITLIDWIFLHLVIPGIEMYVCLYLLNEMTGENYLSGFLQLMSMLFEWIMKTVTGVVVGLQVIQGLVLPAAGQVKGQVFSKLIQALPGIGGGIESASDILMGTGILIKNGIGAAGCLVLGAVCLFPVFEMAVVVLLYQVAGAVIQPVSDGRILNCMNGASYGIRFLLRTTAMAAFLFAVSVALICVFTNRVF